MKFYIWARVILKIVNYIISLLYLNTCVVPYWSNGEMLASCCDLLSLSIWLAAFSIFTWYCSFYHLKWSVLTYFLFFEVVKLCLISWHLHEALSYLMTSYVREVFSLTLYTVSFLILDLHNVASTHEGFASLTLLMITNSPDVFTAYASMWNDLMVCYPYWTE